MKCEQITKKKLDDVANKLKSASKTDLYSKTDAIRYLQNEILGARQRGCSYKDIADIFQDAGIPISVSHIICHMTRESSKNKKED